MNQTYYCPRGCNVFETTSENPECAACGRIMTTDPQLFNDAHEQRELDGIAECERQFKEVEKPE